MGAQRLPFLPGSLVLRRFVRLLAYHRRAGCLALLHNARLTPALLVQSKTSKSAATSLAVDTPRHVAQPLQVVASHLVLLRFLPDTCTNARKHERRKARTCKVKAYKNYLKETLNLNPNCMCAWPTCPGRKGDFM